jgi:hypothetical protein
MLTYLAIGVGAGTIVSSWQGFKDPPWEGFRTAKFVRSIGVAGVLGIAFYALAARGLLAHDNLGLVLLAILATERLIGEIYKGFVRAGDHPEYVTLLARLRIPVGHRIVRLSIGLLLLVLGLALYRGLGWLGAQIVEALGRSAPAGAAIGLMTGTIVAIGGALKDSQFEGFKPLKFVRSPIVSALGTMLLVRFSADPVLVTISAIGFERVAVEFYKTFLTRQVRGIHAGKRPSHPQWFGRRWLFFASYAVPVVACGVLLVA